MMDCDGRLKPRVEMMYKYAKEWQTCPRRFSSLASISVIVRIAASLESQDQHMTNCSVQDDAYMSFWDLFMSLMMAQKYFRTWFLLRSGHRNGSDD